MQCILKNLKETETRKYYGRNTRKRSRKIASNSLWVQKNALSHHHHVYFWQVLGPGAKRKFPPWCTRFRTRASFRSELVASTPWPCPDEGPSSPGAPTPPVSLENHPWKTGGREAAEVRVGPPEAALRLGQQLNFTHYIGTFHNAGVLSKARLKLLKGALLIG